jgi:hypothetical protein
MIASGSSSRRTFLIDELSRLDYSTAIDHLRVLGGRVADSSPFWKGRGFDFLLRLHSETVDSAYTNAYG